MIEDQENRERLSKLLRFYSSKSAGADSLVGLEEYVGRMKEGQKGIYYMVGREWGGSSGGWGEGRQQGDIERELRLHKHLWLRTSGLNMRMQLSAALLRTLAACVSMQGA